MYLAWSSILGHIHFDKEHVCLIINLIIKSMQNPGPVEAVLWYNGERSGIQWGFIMLVSAEDEAFSWQGNFAWRGIW